MAYGEVLARNVRGFRNRKGIGQKSLAARMRALGYTAWFTQTVGKAERGERRITSEEVLGLAYSLDVTVRQLLSPQPDDKRVQLPNGESVEVLSVQRMLAGSNDGAVTWNGDVPVFSAGPPPGWMEDDPAAPDAVRAAWREADKP
jgi:transcriptional regulator with XRE-family HTH domain